MVRKYAIPELDAIFTTLKVFASARQLIIVESKDIVKECRESITAAHSANAAIPGNQEDALKEAQEKAEKAGEILKKLQKRMKSDYGRFWSQDLSEFFLNAEQEVVEAFSTLAVIKQEEIPPKVITFRIQDPDSYKEIHLKTEEVFHVPKESWHQIFNPFEEPCYIIEIQFGEKTSDDDIERLRYYDKN